MDNTHVLKTKTMLCPNNHNVNVESKFCGECGSKLVVGTVAVVNNVNYAYLSAIGVDEFTQLNNEKHSRLWFPHNYSKFSIHFYDGGATNLTSLNVPVEIYLFEQTYEKELKILRDNGLEYEICFGVIYGY